MTRGHDRVGERGVRSTDRGDTLIEILMAMMVLGIASVAIFGAYTMAIVGSGQQKVLAQLDVLLHNFAETATYQIQLTQQTPTSSAPYYATCAIVSGRITPSSSGQSIGSLLYNGQALDLSSLVIPAATSITWSIQYASGNLWNGNYQECLPGPVDQPQMITATATGPRDVSQSLSFVDLRKCAWF